MINILVTCCGSSRAISIANALKFDKRNKVIGSDCDPLSPGQFHVDEFKIVQEYSDTATYWEGMKRLVKVSEIDFIFVTSEEELFGWSKFTYFGGATIIQNHREIVELTIDKKGAWMQMKGALADQKDIEAYVPEPLTENIDEGFRTIRGTEYAIDIIGDGVDNAIYVVPKKILVAVCGVVLKSITVRDKRLVDFGRMVAEIFGNRSTMSVKCVVEYGTDRLYFIHVKSIWSTDLALTVKSGINMPQMMVSTVEKTSYNSDVVMIRHFAEYFLE